MEVLGLLVDVVGPVVVIVAIGALVLARLNVDPKPLATVAYWVLGPAFVYDIFTRSELSGATFARLAAASIGGMVAAGAVALLASRATAQTGSVTRATTMTAVYGNVGNAGLAIVSFALGAEALAYAGVMLLTINVLGITLGVALAAGDRVGLGRAITAGLTTPMTIAAAVAIIVNAFGWSQPLVIERPVTLLAAALIPVMLLSLGLQLDRTPFGGFRVDFAISAVAKLLAAPIAAAVIGRAVGMTDLELGAVVLQSAMPPAVFCLAVALEHDFEVVRVTNAVVGMTVLALVTLPVVIVLVT